MSPEWKTQKGDGWIENTFEDCLYKVKTPNKIPKKKFLEDGLYPIVSQEKGAINGYWDDEGDVFRVTKSIIIYGDHTRIVKYIDHDFVMGADGVKILQPKSFLNSRYFYYYLRAHPVKTLGYARHYRLLKEIQVSYPPLPEQQRIVSILDEAFKSIDQAIANTEKNLANARELFESYLNNVFTQKGESWVDQHIGDFATVYDGPHATPKTISSGPVFLGITALRSGVLNLDKTRHVSDEDYLKWTKRVIPKEDDIVFSYETRLGEIAVIPKGLVCCLGRRMGLVRLDTDAVLPRFFLYQYMSASYKKFLDSQTIKGATVDRIPLKTFPSFPFAVPNLGVQLGVVKQLDQVSNYASTLESIYRKKLDNLAELKQSILQKAFSGELTSEDIKQQVNG